MKRLLVGLLALGSISASANDCKYNLQVSKSSTDIEKFTTEELNIIHEDLKGISCTSTADEFSADYVIRVVKSISGSAKKTYFKKYATINDEINSIYGVKVSKDISGRVLSDNTLNKENFANRIKSIVQSVPSLKELYKYENVVNSTSSIDSLPSGSYIELKGQANDNLSKNCSISGVTLTRGQKLRVISSSLNFKQYTRREMRPATYANGQVTSYQQTIILDVQSTNDSKKLAKRFGLYQIDISSEDERGTITCEKVFDLSNLSEELEEIGTVYNKVKI